MESSIIYLFTSLESRPVPYRGLLSLSLMEVVAAEWERKNKQPLALPFRRSEPV